MENYFQCCFARIEAYASSAGSGAGTVLVLVLVLVQALVADSIPTGGGLRTAYYTWRCAGVGRATWPRADPADPADLATPNTHMRTHTP